MITARLAERGFVIGTPPPGNPLFVPAVRAGNLVFTSGQLPMWGEEKITGKVGADVSMEQAQRAAELCAVNCLQAVGTVADPDSILRVVKVLGMVNVAPDFDDTADVINGCSELLRAVLADRGEHARSAVGLTVPGGWAVEIEMVVEVA
jgi:enamine deaminase RidA (YjgF/YER057c/UK114 family)